MTKAEKMIDRFRRLEETRAGDITLRLLAGLLILVMVMAPIFGAFAVTWYVSESTKRWKNADNQMWAVMGTLAALLTFHVAFYVTLAVRLS